MSISTAAHSPKEFQFLIAEQDDFGTLETGGGNSYTAVDVDSIGSPSLNPTIHPFVIKDGSRSSFIIEGTESPADFAVLETGDLITGSYPQSASITRQYINAQSGTCHGDDTDMTKCGHNMSYWSIRTLLNHYGTVSPHYLVKSDFGDGWDKDTQDLNLIHIPSIFYYPS